MDSRLSAEDLDWLTRLRDAALQNQPLHAPPTRVAIKLEVLGLARASSRGEYSITFRGRDELLDREVRERLR